MVATCQWKIANLLVTLASLARGNMLFLQVILFRKPWRYV